ncbi:metal-dependent hydrolase [Nocardiopsis gilva YIM 90087]|uniref:Metal-dependent hydrolase n=1 Tax=Nocardiopsis gilva YIM 90087 TaxID=1235441 RepID=A0A223SAM6_9ACTN|nr:metal-dependent hydrolase [Nocardiopsis gilva]ASU85175.1 metal-dependent hydrolase [Nocardiopsis gilva YIM 90087]
MTLESTSPGGPDLTARPATDAEPHAPAPAPAPAPADEPDHLVLHPRDVNFDWSDLDLHWIPAEPFATHVINVLHLLLPEGERWFVQVFKEAVPLIRDEKLREEVLGFIGQEAVHAEAHAGVLDHMDAHGLDPEPYVSQVAWMFRKLLGDRGLTGPRASAWLRSRLALIAGIEHMTAVLGQWVLDAKALDRAKADPTMLDLLRWHGAEEVEHRAVAFDLFVHLDGRYSKRALAMAVSTVTLGVLWVRGVRFLMANDPVLRGAVKPQKPRWRDMLRSGRVGITPSLWHLARSVPGYFRPGYHPSQHGSTSQAVAYLASSPAARAAEH